MSDYTRAASAGDVPEGEARVVEIDGRSIALCHVKGDAIYAIDNVCSHDDGPLGNGTLHGDRVECPRHGALFDVRTGDPKALPAVRAVRSYQVRIVDGGVEVALDG
jgi:3-phenylpropionate/trans-cinnamate dioxygenase ferredoxin subunit